MTLELRGSAYIMFGIFTLIGCQPEPIAPQPEPVSEKSILLITIDTLRADRVGAYGDPLAQTANMDALAAEGVLFREAHSVTPLTLPAHASILTGMYPKNHKIRDNAGFRLGDEAFSIAEALQEAQYHTAAFVSAYVLDGAFGLGQGFDVYRDPFHPMDVSAMNVFGELELPSIEVVNAAISWWKHTEGSKFAWVHLYDPHTPWNPPTEWSGDPYRAEVSYVDSVIGRLLDTAGKDSLIILTSDHGESLWEGGEREHGMLIHRAVTRVPLIVRPPGGLQKGAQKDSRTLPYAPLRPSGVDGDLNLEAVPDAPKAAHVVDTAVSGVDIAATIAEHVGLAFQSDGRSLMPAIRQESLESQTVYAETLFPAYHYGFHPLTALQTDDRRVEIGAWARAEKWTTGKKIRVSDATLARSRQFFGDEIPQPAPPLGEQASALAALGYIADSVPLDLDGAPDPRDLIDVVSQIQLAQGEEASVAIPKLLAILESHPLLVDARLGLSLKYTEAGDLDSALAACETILESYPMQTTVLNNAAILARQLKRPKEALAYAERLMAINANDPRGYRIAAAIHVDAEAPKEVISIAEAGLKQAPEDPNLLYLLGLAYIFERQPAKAIPLLKAAQQHGSRAGDISLWLAMATERSGEIDQAISLYEKAAQKMTGDLRPWVFGGIMLVNANRCAEAKSFLVNAARRGAIADPTVQAALQKCQIRL